MAFRFETANERWKWFKLSDNLNPMNPMNLHYENNRSGLKDLWDPNGVGTNFYAAVTSFLNSKGIQGQADEGTTQAIEEFLYSPRENWQAIANRRAPENPSIWLELADFSEKWLHQNGWTPDQGSQQTLSLWQDEFPYRKMMPRESPGDPSPMLDETQTFYPNTNEGRPSNDASDEEWENYDDRKEFAREREEKNRIERLKGRPIENLSPQEFNDMAYAEAENTRLDPRNNQNDASIFLKKIYQHINLFDGIDEKLKDIDIDELDSNDRMIEADAILDIIGENAKTLEVLFDKWQPLDKQTISYPSREGYDVQSRNSQEFKSSVLLNLNVLNVMAFSSKGADKEFGEAAHVMELAYSIYNLLLKVIQVNT